MYGPTVESRTDAYSLAGLNPSNAPTGSLNTDFNRDGPRIPQEAQAASPRPERIRNALLMDVVVKVGATTYSFAHPLRLVLEFFGDAGTIASAVPDRSISGFGQSATDAVSELINALVSDFLFYATTNDRDLTLDAVERRTELQRLFTGVD